MTEQPNIPPKNKGSFMSQLLSGAFLTHENFMSKLPFMLYLVFLMICYISYGYFAEKTVRELSNAGDELKELKAEYTTNFSQLEKMKQQSNVAFAIQSTGLKESRVPPKKIVVKKDK